MNMHGGATPESARADTAVGVSPQCAVWPRYAFPLVIAALALAATWLMSSATYNAERDRALRLVDREAQRVADVIDEVFTSYQQVLRAGAGFVRAAGRPTEESWRTFTQGLALDRLFPGIQGFGYVDVFDRAGIARIVERERAAGRPDFVWRPDGERDLYTAIVYLEPANPRNQRALGFDMYSEEIRRKAMQQARDTGEPVLSGLVRLVQDDEQGGQKGGLSYVPIYVGRTLPNDLEGRRAALTGYVYGVFRWSDFIQRSLAKHAPQTLERVELKVVANTPAGDERVLFDSRKPDGSSRDALFKISRTMNVGGWPWELRVSTRPAFESSFDWSRSRLLFAMGLVLTVLLSAIGWLLASSRDRAMAAAADLAHEMEQRRKAQDQLVLTNGELIHRVKNTLAIVSAIASQTARNSSSLPEFTRSFRDRLAALGTVQDLLRPDPAYAPDLGAFITEVLKAFGGSGAERLRVEGPRLNIPRNEAVMLSLLLNELATNATKYGAWSVAGGRVDVGWHVANVDGEERVTMVWKESGGPVPEVPRHAGFGTQVIQSIERGLRGKVTRDLERDGLRVAFEFPRPRPS